MTWLPSFSATLYSGAPGSWVASQLQGYKSLMALRLLLTLKGEKEIVPSGDPEVIGRSKCGSGLMQRIDSEDDQNHHENGRDMRVPLTALLKMAESAAMVGWLVPILWLAFQGVH